MDTLNEPAAADYRGLQVIGMMLAALLVTTTVIAAMLVHRGPAGEAYGSGYNTSAQRLR